MFSVPLDPAKLSIEVPFPYFVQILLRGAAISPENFAYSQSLITMTNLTLFVPNSQVAYDAFVNKALNATESAFRSILNAHSVNDVHYDDDLVAGAKMRNLQGSDLTIYVAPNGTKYVNGAQILSTDYLIVPGVVHVIDRYVSFSLIPYNIS